jgi:hypothetical protein
MKTLSRWLMVAMLTLSALGILGAAEPSLVYQGVMWEDGQAFVALQRASGGARWFKVGASIDGFTLRRLESEGEVLVLAKDGKEFSLRRAQSQLRVGGLEPPPHVVKAIMNNMRQLSAAADQYFLENGVSQARFDDLVGPTNYIRRIVAVEGETYPQTFAQGKPVEVRTASGYVLKYAP